MLKTLKLDLDCKIDKHDYLTIMQGFTYNYEFYVFDDGEAVDLTGVTVNIDFMKPDKKFIIKTSGISKDGNKLMFGSDLDYTNISGKAKMQVVLKKNYVVFGSWVIDVVIKPSAINDNDGQSENKLTITQELKDVIAKAEADIVSIPIEAEKKINELTSQANTSIDTLKTNTQKTLNDLTNQANTSINNVSSNADTKINALITKSNQTIANLEQAIANGDIESIKNEVFEKEYGTFTTNKSMASVGETTVTAYGITTLEEPMLEEDVTTTLEESTEEENGIMTMEEPMLLANTVVEPIKTGIPKSATFKGQTLVECCTGAKNRGATFTSGIVRYVNVCQIKNSLIKPNTKYLITFDIKNLNLDGLDSVYLLFEPSTGDTFLTSPTYTLKANGHHKVIATTKSELNGDSWILIKGVSNQWEGSGSTVRSLSISNFQVIEYQDGMENWDIPYFEGMASVVNPSVTNVGKTLLSTPKEKEYGKDATSEFFQVVDCASVFDTFGVGETYFFSFDIKANKSGNARIYLQNGTGARHYFQYEVPVTTEYVKRSFKANVRLNNVNQSQSFFAVYTTYDSGCFATIKNIIISKVESDEPYKSNTVATIADTTLRSVSSEVYDELDLKTGILTRRVLEFTLSSSGWTNNYKSNDNFASNISYFNSMAMFDVPVLCDKLPSLTADEWNNMTKSGVYIGKHDTMGAICGVVLPKSVLSEDTINAFVQYMSQNPITFNYGFSTTYNTEKNKTTGVPFIYEDGHILLSADSILPTLEYTVATTLRGQGENTAEELLDVKLNKLGKTEKASDSALLNGVKEDTSATGNTIVKRDSYGGANFKNLTMNNNNSLYGITTGGGTVSLAYLSSTNKTTYGAITNSMLLRSKTQPLLNINGTEKEILSQHNLPIESGTFTPNIKTITSGVYFTLNEDTFGRYQRIGNKVFVNMRIAWTTKNNAPTGEGVVIGGLPYAPRYSYETLTIGLYHGLGLPSSALELVTHISSGNGGIVLYYTQSATNWLIYTPQHINNEGSIAISGFYTI